MKLHNALVSQVDPVTARAKVKFPDLDRDTDVEEPGMESPWLTVLQQWSLGAQAFCMPSLGELVVILMNDSWQDGVVLGGRYNRQDVVPTAPPKSRHFEFTDGTVLEYDPDAHLLKAMVQGDILAHATGNATIQADGVAKLQGGSIILDGPTEVTGTLKVDGKLTTLDDVDVAGNGTVGGNWMTTGINSPHHSHPGGVPPGP